MGSPTGVFEQVIEHVALYHGVIFKTTAFIHLQHAGMVFIKFLGKLRCMDMIVILSNFPCFYEDIL